MNGQSLDENLGKEFVGFDKDEDCQCSAEAITLGRNAAKKYKRETQQDTQVKKNCEELLAKARQAGRKFVKGCMTTKATTNPEDVKSRVKRDAAQSDGQIKTNDASR